MSVQKFYFHESSSGVSGTLPTTEHSGQTSEGTVSDSANVRTMDGSVGAGQTSAFFTHASPAAAHRTWFRTFISAPLARQTIDAGNWQLSAAAKEANLNSNFRLTTVIYAWRPSTGAVVGSLISDFLASTAEASTTQSSVTDTTIAGTAVDILDGDVLVCEIWRDATTSVTSGYLNTFYYDGTTEASTTSCASFLLAPLPIFVSGEHAPTFNRTTGFPQGNGTGGANNTTTFAVNPGSAVGDVIFAFVGIASNTITSTAVSSSRTSGWTKIESFNDSTNTYTLEIWQGHVDSTGTHTITVTYSASVASVITEIDVDGYRSSRTSPVWWSSTAGGRHATGGTSNNYPTLTPSVDGAQAYIGISSPVNGGVAGSSTGYTYNLPDAGWVVMASRVGVVGAQTPNAGQTPTGTATLVGAIISDAPIDGTGSLGLKKPALQLAGGYTVRGTGSIGLKKPALQGETHAFVRSSSTYATSSAGETGFSIALPTGWQQNDVCYIAVEARGTSATINTPSGWTAVAATFNAFGQTNSAMKVVRRVLQSGDTDPVAFTGASARFAAVATAIQAADTTTPEDGVAASEAAQSAATNSPVANAVTPTRLNDLLLCFFGAGDPTTANVAMTFTAPSGMTLINQASSAQAGATDAGMMASSLVLTTNSSTGTKTATITPSSGSVACNSQAVTLVVRASAYDVLATDTGTGSIGLKKPALSASGSEKISGTGSVALKKPALSVSAAEEIAGTGSVALKKPSIQITQTPPSGVTGTGSIALKKPALSVSATEKESGTGSVSLKKPSISIAAKERFVATGGVGLKKPSISIAAKEKYILTGGAALKKPALSASGSEKISGTGSVALKKPALFIFSSNNVTGTGSVGLKKPGLSVSAKEKYIATGSAAIKKPHIQAAGGPYIAGTGSMGLKKPQLTISAKEREAATGGAKLKKPSLSASGTVTYHSTGTGSIGLKKPALSLDGFETIFASGSIHMKKMRIEAHEFSIPADALFAMWPV